ncbi:MAG: hypothetical protein JW837_05780 [Sedimentisphaerales bacterium]|nr:hypothetical protein [Sedimentisphaerales bacterium]
MFNIALFQLAGAIVLLTFLWFVFLKGYKTKTGQKVVMLIFVFLLLFFVWEVWNRIVPRNIFGIIPDVSRRLTSPDRSKRALLIRRQAFDLNFKVEVNGKELFYSHDYVPDLTFNWNENINWSKDSSLLVLSIHEPDTSEPFKWAYDFKEQKEFLDRNVIEALWIERNL